MSEGLFRFVGRAVVRDESGYHHARWDKAKPVEVLASTRAEATEKAVEMLGDPQRRGWSWALRWDSMREEREEAREFLRELKAQAWEDGFNAGYGLAWAVTTAGHEGECPNPHRGGQ